MNFTHHDITLKLTQCWLLLVLIEAVFHVANSLANIIQLQVLGPYALNTVGLGMALVGGWKGDSGGTHGLLPYIPPVFYCGIEA